jgi:hypothetical protein
MRLDTIMLIESACVQRSTKVAPGGEGERQENSTVAQTSLLIGAESHRQARHMKVTRILATV